MEIPHHNQACDFGLAPLGIKAKFGPFATPLNYIQDTLSCILYEIPFLALPGISRFSSNHFHRSVLRIAQWPTGLLPTLMKSLLTFPRNNMFPLHQFPYFWIVTGKRVQKYFFQQVLCSQKLPYSFQEFGWDTLHLAIEAYHADILISISVRLIDGRERWVLYCVI